MIKDTITLDETVEFLNTLLKIDPVAVGNIFGFRVPCNKDLANHPSVQVWCEGELCQVGMIGILNGLFGTNKNGCGNFAANMDNGILKNFIMLE